MVVRERGCGLWRKTVIGAGPRHKVFVALNGHRRLVVSKVSRSPCVVWYENKLDRTSAIGQVILLGMCPHCMQCKSNKMVDPTVR